MIREFQSGDLDRVAEIWLEANLQAHSFIPRQYWQGQLAPVKAMLPQAKIFVFQGEEGELQGFLGLNGERIEGLFIWGPVRAQGLGKQLLDHAKAANNRLTLCVYQRNSRAAAFYRREGFQVEGEGIDENTGELEYRMVWRADVC